MKTILKYILCLILGFMFGYSFMTAVKINEPQLIIDISEFIRGFNDGIRGVK